MIVADGLPDTAAACADENTDESAHRICLLLLEAYNGFQTGPAYTAIRLFQGIQIQTRPSLELEHHPAIFCPL